MAYTGIARHVREGTFYLSINAFRSPLVSWLIAVLSIANRDYLHLGKLVSVCSWLLCLALLYVFTLRLAHSRVAAGVAALLFTLGQGLCVIAVAFVTPDFLFSALVLIYFLLLLQCLASGGDNHWFSLGGIHGLAFLAKAFALPWLACCTMFALLLTNATWKVKGTRLLQAAVIPLLVAVGWATVLHSKYGSYTTGSQFKANLLQWVLREDSNHRPKTYTYLRDTSQNIDVYAVDDPVPPGSWAWSYHVSTRQVIPKLLLAETRNIPKAFKQPMVVLTPGVLLAFVYSLAIAVR